MSSSVCISGESPPWTQRNCWFMIAARGRQSNASMHASYTFSEYFILPTAANHAHVPTIHVPRHQAVTYYSSSSHLHTETHRWLTAVKRSKVTLDQHLLLWTVLWLWHCPVSIIQLSWNVNQWWSPSVLWYCWLGLLTCKNRLPYNLYCVGGDVKHCSLTHSLVNQWWTSARPTVSMLQDANKNYMQGIK